MNLAEQQALRYGAQKVKLYPDWIDCKVRLPDSDSPTDMIKVLGWDGLQAIRVDYYKYEDEESGRFRVSCLKCFNEITDSITHWMPLPEPPTK